MDSFIMAMTMVVIGLILYIYEALSPGAFMLIPGTVLIIIGIVQVLNPGLIYSQWFPIVAIVVTISATIFTIKVYQRLAPPVPPSTIVAESLIGKIGIITVPTEIGNMKGKVKIDSDVWSATSDDQIEVGSKVIVESGHGVHVHVRKL